MGLGNYDNMGDRIIGECVYYLVKQIKPECNISCVNFQPERIGKEYERYRARRRRIENKGLGIIEYKFIYHIMKEFVKKYYIENLKNANALILACGSFKYRTQNLWTTYSIAVECAKKYDIPVMFDAMNIQDYDGKDWRCKLLKNRANYSNVRMITSRDGIHGVNKLTKYYINNKNIEMFPAGDPAFWVKECYEPQTTKQNKIGINLIRGNIFEDYGGGVSEEQLLELYSEIVMKLNARGEEWELFTNGLKCDYDFGKKLLKKCGYNEENHKIFISKNTNDCVNKIMECKAVIGARLHACICAYSLDVPMAGFVWDDKLIHFAEMSKTKEYFCLESNLSSEELLNKLSEAIKLGYDIQNRNYWKNQTKNTIKRFLDEL